MEATKGHRTIFVTFTLISANIGSEFLSTFKSLIEASYL
jgi:hypothetical protein